MIVTEPRLDANTRTFRVLTEAMRQELCDWIRDHGLEPANVAAVERDVIDCPLIRADIYLRNEAGHMFLDEATGHAARETVELLERSDPPVWWRP